MNLSDVRDRETISVEEAGAILGLRRSAAYSAARRGQIPVLALGRRLFVPTRKLAAMLGADWISEPVNGATNSQVGTDNDGSGAGHTSPITHSDPAKRVRTDRTEGEGRR